MEQDDNSSLDPITSAKNYTICSFPINSSSTKQLSFAFFMNGPFLFIIVMVGFFGNILCLFAFSRSRRPAQINYYLIALSLWDLCLVVGSFFLYNLPYLIYGRAVTQGPYVLAYPFIYAVACAAHSGSIWAVIASGTDRYFALCHPLTHKVYSCARRTALILIIQAILVLVYNSPRYYELEISTCLDRISGASVPSIRPSRLRANTDYYFWYKVIGGLVLFSFGPLLILIFLSAKVWLAVNQLTRKDLPIEQKINSTKRRVQLTKPNNNFNQATSLIKRPPSKRVLRRHSTLGTIGQESQYALNSMLLTVIVKFVICHSLPSALDVCEAIMPVYKFNSTFISNIVALSNFLVVCNSSMNIFVYCICSRRFRHDLCMAPRRRSGRVLKSQMLAANGLTIRLSDTQCKSGSVSAGVGRDSCRRATIANL